MSLRAILWVLYESDTTLGSRLVLLALADNADDDGCNAFPSVPTLAKKARMSEKGARDALRRLERDGAIKPAGQSRFGTTVYEILGISTPGENPGDTGAEVTSPPEVDDSKRLPSSAEPSLEQSSENRESDLVAETWGKLAPPLIAHPPTVFKSGRYRNALAAARRTYEIPQIVKAIENYAAIFESKGHYWKHRYSVIEFLNRPRAIPGVDRFVDEAMPFENFASNRDRDAAGGTQRTPVAPLQSAEAWVLNTAWMLPLDEYEIAELLGKRGVEGPDRTRLLGLWREKKKLAA